MSFLQAGRGGKGGEKKKGGGEEVVLHPSLNFAATDQKRKKEGKRGAQLTPLHQCGSTAFLLTGKEKEKRKRRPQLCIMN